MVTPALPGIRAVVAGDGYILEVATPDGTVLDSCPSPHLIGTRCPHWQRLYHAAMDLALPVGGWDIGASISEHLAAAAAEEEWQDLPCVPAREVYDLMVRAELAAGLGVARRLTVVAGQPETQIGIELDLEDGRWRVTRAAPSARHPGVYLHSWGIAVQPQDPQLDPR